MLLPGFYLILLVTKYSFNLMVKPKPGILWIGFEAVATTMLVNGKIVPTPRGQYDL